MINPPRDTSPVDIDRLAAHRALVGTPRAELEWIAAHGEQRRYDAGDVIVAKSDEAVEMVVVLTGCVATHLGHGTGRIHKMEAPAGELSGLLPFSRMGPLMGDAVASGTTELVAIHRDHFPALIRECPVITASLVHAMVDRARVAAGTNWQDEKMISLGRLAAGFAHQLNNPASASVRSAKQIGAALTSMGDAAQAFGRTNLDASQHARVTELLSHCLQATSGGGLSTMQRADREELIVDWLATNQVDTSVAASLADCGIAVDTLQSLAQAIPKEALEPSLRWVAAAHSAQALATEVERASGRIFELILGMVRFTRMDRAAVAEPIDVAQGLADTLNVLSGRAAEKHIAVRLEVAPDLPKVTAHSVDLNQVWSNLVENAIDAAPPHGEVRICVKGVPNAVVVHVIDNGPGIAPDVEARMFDPFFTTKDVGQGMGFGLDIVRRIVQMHDGEIEVDTCPGCTEFRVRIPTDSTES